MLKLSEAERTLALLAATPGWAELAQSHDIDDQTVIAVLDEAAKFAREELHPIGVSGDSEGCRLQDGRVITPRGYPDAFAAMAEGGWQAMDLPDELGGQGLPTAMHSAASLFFEAEAMAFMMSASRPAAHLINALSPEIARQWLPKLAAGEWATTICISEPGAGSDVGRIRTKATRTDEGWQVSGSKCWISFGDHDLSSRIGHCMLARTGSPEAGTRGLSLFLVPDRHEDGSRNGVSVSRIEEKLGIHGSPTCVMDFDASHANLLGDEGRGIQQMFRMIELMRLQTACQGLGVAQRATRIAFGYASERLQGGMPDKPPVPIIEHADVRRQLTAMDAQTEVLRAVVLEVSVLLDQARAGDERAGDIAAFLLPLAKNFGGETAFNVANSALQVLGGAGYTREWPIEQLLRDARVITIYEGTTGIQAQDFLHRRVLRDKGKTLDLFLSQARAELSSCSDASVKRAVQLLLDRFAALSECFIKGSSGVSSANLSADGYMRAGWVAVSSLMVCRMLDVEDLSKLAYFRLHQLSAEMSVAENACSISSEWVMQ
ncbi:MAG: acyl-CoA dehydrogenase family protein [Granulosicoccus sp.]